MTSPNPNNELPHYEQPPVVEVILGVQFDRLPKFTNAHLGAFWKSLPVESWANVSDATPLPTQFERFENSTGWVRGVQFQFTQDPMSRLRIKSSSGDQMIQIQNGRLHLNWLGSSGSTYPRFDAVLTGFNGAVDSLERFVETFELGAFSPNQWEVTYINHIHKGTVWNTPADWDFFKPLAAMPSVDGLLSAESFSGEWHFVIPQNRGRLHAAWQHGQDDSKKESASEMVVLTITARGPIKSEGSSRDQLLDGIKLGHDTVVQGFSKLMSDRANQYWGLHRASN